MTSFLTRLSQKASSHHRGAIYRLISSRWTLCIDEYLVCTTIRRVLNRGSTLPPPILLYAESQKEVARQSIAGARHTLLLQLPYWIEEKIYWYLLLQFIKSNLLLQLPYWTEEKIYWYLLLQFIKSNLLLQLPYWSEGKMYWYSGPKIRLLNSSKGQRMAGCTCVRGHRMG